MLKPFYSRQGDILQFSLHKLKEKLLDFLICDKNRVTLTEKGAKI